MPDQIRAWAALLGPNVYLQAIIIAVAFVIIRKIADLVIARVLGRISRRTTTDVDDNLVALLHKPVFVSFVVLGLALATAWMELPDSPAFLTLGLLKTIAIVVWYNFFRSAVRLLLTAMARRPRSPRLHVSIYPLVETALRVTLLVMAIYFGFLAWNIDVTAWLASAGIVGLALSFAAKDTLSNLFAGVSIAADAPYKIGDFINLDTGERGLVTHIGMRSTRYPDPRRCRNYDTEWHHRQYQDN